MHVYAKKTTKNLYLGLANAYTMSSELNIQKTRKCAFPCSLSNDNVIYANPLIERYFQNYTFHGLNGTRFVLLIKLSTVNSFTSSVFPMYNVSRTHISIEEECISTKNYCATKWFFGSQI